MVAEAQKKALRRFASKKKAKELQCFFKTGPGEYGEGDIFVGVTVPNIRKVAKEYSNSVVADLVLLLKSPIHEERLLALLIMVEQFNRGSESERRALFNLYLKHTKNINNWDLVDLSAHRIIGAFLFDKNRQILERFAKSKILWERRIAVLSTFYFIGQGEYAFSLKISKLLLKDEEDLIHKAVGWMLREIGKRDLKAEEDFLKVHYRNMPRTMLRYAIERFPESRRKAYLLGRV